MSLPLTPSSPQAPELSTKDASACATLRERTETRKNKLPHRRQYVTEKFFVDCVRWKIFRAQYLSIPEPPNWQTTGIPFFIWSWRRDLNPRPSDYKSDALPTELRQRTAPDKQGKDHKLAQRYDRVQQPTLHSNSRARQSTQSCDCSGTILPVSRGSLHLTHEKLIRHLYYKRFQRFHMRFVCLAVRDFLQ